MNYIFVGDTIKNTDFLSFGKMNYIFVGDTIKNTDFFTSFAKNVLILEGE